MTEFQKLLSQAQTGDNAAMEEILLLFEPIISRYSRMYGQEDEDLRQVIIMEIIVATKKWRRVQNTDS